MKPSPAHLTLAAECLSGFRSTAAHLSLVIDCVALHFDRVQSAAQHAAWERGAHDQRMATDAGVEAVNPYPVVVSE